MANAQLTCDKALTACASECRTVAYEHCRDVDHRSELIILSLDCADLCRQTSMLWRSKSEKTKAIALQCVEACDQLIRHLTDDTSDYAHRLSDCCLKAKRCCSEIAAQPWVSNHSISYPTATVCYGITLPASIYRA